jgi:hypothetical protein
MKLYMVVGYTPRQPTADLKMMRAGQGKQGTLVGVKEPVDGNIVKWGSREPTVLVVTEVRETKPDRIQLWAIIKPRNGLCVPHAIGQDLVFYRHEFRDSVSGHKKRCGRWNANVALHSVKPGVDAAPLTEKQQQFKRARNGTRFVFVPNVSLCNEIAFLAANYACTSDNWFLQEIEDVLQSVDNNIKYRPLPENSGLHTFVEAEDELTEDQGLAVVADFLAMWPGTPHVVAEHVMVLQAAMVKTQTHLSYRLLKPFIAEGCWQISEGEVDAD